MRLGVIDCGTNTFHLLIADPQPDGTFSTVFKERNYVRLGQDGLDAIGAAPFERGIACIQYFKEKIAEYGVDKVRAFGTEALRRAANGPQFVAAVAQASGIDIQIITGEEEACLIHLGVMQALPPFEGKGLIMDIGGGSVECIIANGSQVFWAKSFPLGVQVLFSAFHKNDPIQPPELQAIEAHLQNTLQSLFEALKHHETPFLIGASGSFEVVEEMLLEEKPHPLYSIVPAQKFYDIYSIMLASPLSERLQMPKLPPERAELIVVAFVLIDFIIRKAGIRQIITSAHAMKEGILKEMQTATV